MKKLNSKDVTVICDVPGINWTEAGLDYFECAIGISTPYIDYLSE